MNCHNFHNFRDISMKFFRVTPFNPKFCTSKRNFCHFRKWHFTAFLSFLDFFDIKVSCKPNYGTPCIFCSAHTHTHMHTPTNTHTLTPITRTNHTLTQVCTHTCSHTCAHTQVCTHTRTHTHTFSSYFKIPAMPPQLIPKFPLNT